MASIGVTKSANVRMVTTTGSDGGSEGREASEVAATAPEMVPSSPQVSAQMSRLPRKDTGPEVALRRLLFARGFRYRLHVRVPGLPRRTVDVAFPGIKVAVFMDGCFWHGCPEHGILPLSNHEWWVQKLAGNRRRDSETTAHLESLGWHVLRFWSHEDLMSVADAVARCVRERRVERTVSVGVRTKSD